jgi:HEXXH motif-containing protein
MNIAVETIAWERMAQPQDDHYDTEVTLALATSNGYRRREPGPGATLLDGAIALAPDPDLLFAPDCEPADPGHPNVARVERLLRRWPAVFAQARKLLDTIVLFHHRSFTSDMVVGSICGPGSRGFGSIATTVDHHVGFAEAIVHEMGHHKLRALGVDFERAGRIVRNPRGQTYPSPIRYDCLRPMTAVLHAQYSYTYIIQLDLKILEAREDRERDAQIVSGSLSVILPKLEFGLEVLKEHLEADSAGDAFVAGLYSWTDRLLAEGDDWLREYGVSTQPFVHPIAASTN